MQEDLIIEYLEELKQEVAEIKFLLEKHENDIPLPSFDVDREDAT